jgi:adenylate cyclase
MERRLAAILAADMVGYSKLMAVDETGTIDRQKMHRSALIDPKIAQYGGRIVKTTGDGLLVEFPSVVDAVQCAIEIQRAMPDREAEVPDASRIRYRIGINLGDIVVDGDDILGDGVNIAARLEGLSEPEGLCISDVVYQNIQGKLDLTFDDLGERTLKNMERKVRVWRWTDTPNLAANEPKPASAALPLPEKPSIAVLPFTNMSGDAEQEYFSDGITEDIITELSRFRDLFVIARNSSFAYKNKSAKVQEVAKDLGVRYVVEGSVRAAGKRVRVTAQLIDGLSGHHIWAERYDRELTDIFVVQDEITQMVVSTVAGKVKLTSQDSAIRKPTEDMDAYTWVLRGQGIVADSAVKHLEARRAYERAAELDPTYARAYAGLAMCDLVGMANHLEESDEAALDHGLDCAAQAVALDHDDSKSQYLLGYFLQLKGRLKEAKLHNERAVSLNPNDADALATMGKYYHETGALEEAINCYMRAIRLNPYHPVWYLWQLGLAYYTSKRYEDALSPLQEAVSRHPKFIFPRRVLAAALAQLDRTVEARKVVEGILADQPNASVRQRDTYVLGTATNTPAWADHWFQGLRKAGLPD